MRVGLDAGLTVGTATGIGQYVRGLERALAAAGVEVVALSDPRIDPWRFDRRVYWDQIALPSLARAARVDIVHCASGTMPLALALPTVVTVHDVAWLRRAQAHARFYARWYFGTFSIARYRRATRIVVDSTFSRDELIEVGGLPASSMDVVYPGVDQAFGSVVRRADARTILVVGTIEPRKNLKAVVRALPALPEARIVAVGPHTPYAGECAALAASLGVAHRLEMPGYVTADALLELYATAAVAAVPSEYEGFGYAAAQALCAGLPPIVSDRSSLPEVVAGDALVLALEDDAAWIAALRDGLSGRLEDRARTTRDAARERFAWSTAARRLIGIYTEALAAN
ncbi:MAG TPA: glycosyltransferase family 1 protein [Candidatus Baltobacteraceae bacterium]